MAPAKNEILSKIMRIHILTFIRFEKFYSPGMKQTNQISFENNQSEGIIVKRNFGKDKQ